jgi:hypothetical protein
MSATRERELLLTALRVLDSCIEHNPPSGDDEARLRQVKGDLKTPIDDLACEIIADELRKRRSVTAGS